MGGTKFANHVLKHPDMYIKMIDYIIDYSDEKVDEKI